MPQSPTPAQLRLSSRSGRHRIYALAAALGLLVLAAVLYVNHSLVALHEDAAHADAARGARRRTAADLEAAAAAVKAPAGEVFATGDVAGASARLWQQLERFQVNLATARTDLGDAATSGAGLAEAEGAARALAAEAVKLFAALRQGRRAEATAHLQAVNRADADIRR